MRTIKLLAVIGLAVVLVGSTVIVALALATAEAKIRSALVWTSASVSTSTTDPAAACLDTGWNLGKPTGPLTCRSPAAGAGGKELAIATAEARLAWSGRVEVTAIGSEAGAKVEVTGPDPKSLPDVLQANTRFKIKVTPSEVKGTPQVEVSLFSRAQPKDKNEALAPVKVIASTKFKLERVGEQEIELSLQEQVKKDELGLQVTLVATSGVPTLTEWGLIALAVLLAGGMGYMIYRRRPALRPAAP